MYVYKREPGDVRVNREFKIYNRIKRVEGSEFACDKRRANMMCVYRAKYPVRY